jgi:hypothetical protein
VWAPQNAGVQVVRSPSEAMQDLPVTTVLAALDQA